jgi:hypothetical protein
VWDHRLQRWWGDPFPDYPGELLADLNSPSVRNLCAGVEAVPKRPAILHFLRALTFAVWGAILGGALSYWLLLRSAPPPGQLECGLPMLFLGMFLLPLGALIGSVLCLGVSWAMLAAGERVSRRRSIRRAMMWQTASVGTRGIAQVGRDQ